MKKLLTVLLIVGMCSSAWASNISTEAVLNKVADLNANCLVTRQVITPDGVQVPQRGTLTLFRDHRNTPDAAKPSAAGASDAVDLTGWNRAIIIISVDAVSGAGWELTPLFGDATVNKYFSGTTRTVSADAIFYVDVYGEDDFYMQCSGATGTDPMMTLYLIPSN